MKTPTRIPALLSPRPLAQGEMMKVRGSETARTRNPQTLTLPSPFGKGEASNALQ
jgi:hypothetical protein